MDAKRALTNGVWCPIPWTGLMYNHDGKIKNCIRSAGSLGNLCENSIEEVLIGEINLNNQSRMLQDLPVSDCHTCYDLENGKKNLDIISDRIFYIKELKQQPFDTYVLGNHDLKVIDVRWSNLCNFACVYCGPDFSSRWAQELAVHCSMPDASRIDQFRNWVFERVSDLKHVYLAGGEPLLMKENLELLSLLQQKNPTINLRINTNLSKVNTKIFDMICQFPNVHWTVSVETTGQEFEYVRYGGCWSDFLHNLEVIRSLDHKITFNMLYFLLNFRSFFDCVDYFKQLGFHNNSFVAGALLGPLYLNVRHLPDPVLQSVRGVLQKRIDEKPGYLLEDSYRNIMDYISQPFTKNLADSIQRIKELDRRRNTNSTEIFTELYSLQQGSCHG